MNTLLQLYFNLNKYILNPLIGLAVAVAVIWILWGGIMLIIASQNGDSSGKERYKKHMIFGVIGLFIMVSVFGILEIVMNALRFIAQK